MKFTSKLMHWYRESARVLPWRNSDDPYKIWLSEVILQQTRVAQGTPYYIKFTERFPDVRSLANAPEDEVMKLWQGLGYYSRARNLMKCAKAVVELHNAKFPADYDQLLALPGIGPYTAAAISSAAFNLPHAVVDGNVIRVLSRIHAIEIPVDSSEGRKLIDAMADQHLDKADPGSYNQAIMDLGAGICSPRNPDCELCPVSAFCMAREKNITDRLPVKAGKTKVRKRYFNYLDINNKGQTYLKRRSEGDIWTGLYDFPMIESEIETEAHLLKRSDEWKKIFGEAEADLISVSPLIKHVLSHQIIYARFYKVETCDELTSLNDHILLESSELESYPVARLMEKYISSL